MLFTAGNVITIIIVLVIQLLFRQLDKNNRSLNNVKRFLINSMHGLEKDVDQKTQEVKNLMIEVDLNLKKGDEVLKKVTKIEDWIKGKVSDIDTINEKVADCDKSINELAGMMGMVDENLKRLHKESEFVDKVANRLKSTQTKMLQIEKDVPSLLENFDKANQHKFEELQKELFIDVERQTAIILEELATGEQRIEDLSAHLNSIEEQRDQIAEQTITEINNNLNNVLDEAESKAEKITADFNNEIENKIEVADERIEKITTNASSKIDELFVNTDAKAKELSTNFNELIAKKIKSANESLSKITSTITAKINELVGGAENKIESISTVFNTSVDNTVNSATEAVKNITTDMNAGINRAAMDADSKVEAMSADLNSLFESKLQVEEDRLNTLSSNFTKKVDELEIDAKQRRSEITKAFEASFDDAVVILEQKRSEIELQFENYEKSFKDNTEGIDTLLIDKLSSFKEDVAKLENNYRQKIKSAIENSEKFEGTVFANLKNYIDKNTDAVHEHMNEIIQKIETDALSFKTDIETSFNESRSSFFEIQDSMKKENNEAFLEFSTKQNELKSKLVFFETEFSEKLDTVIPGTKQMVEKIENETIRIVDSTKKEVFKRVDAMIDTVTEKEKSLSDFEENLAYKLTRIEEITNDIDLLENNLKKMVDSAVSGVNTSIAEVSAELNDKWEQADSYLQKDILTLRNIISEFEAELKQLKDRSFEKVSEKLNVFEEGFLKKLAEKETLLENNVKELNESLNVRIANISENTENTGVELETFFKNNLQQRVSELSEFASSEYGRYEVLVGEYENKLKKQFTGIDSSIETLKEDINTQIEDSNTFLENLLKNEVEKSKLNISNSINHFVRESESSMKEAETLVLAENKKIKDQVEVQQNEMELWQARLEQQLSEAESQLQEQASAIKLETFDRISKLREAMSEQKNDFDNLSSEILKRSRELQSELDKQIKGFEEKSQEVTEGFNLAAKRVYEKIEEQGRELSFTIDEIDKHQKSFVAQTKIFERADSMRESLENSISDLQIEIMRVEKQAGQIKDAEKKFLAIKKMGESAASKLAEFMTEKRRIDALDADFQRLMTLSQTVDMKLNQVVSADDSIQLVQAKLKQLEGLLKEIDGRYERLQKKEKIVDATIDGVDRSFKQLNDLDQMISVISERNEPLHSKVDEIARKIDILSRNKQQIDSAVSHIDTLDETVLELENRIEDMQKAREWLAATETRLEEVNRQSQEQVKLLGTLMKGSDSIVRGSGAPAHEIRDVVIKLARQGWAVEQIVKSTKLSRGEVELILELQPKK